jgi:3-hydroxyisobutyrate dehydrogenase-like beta-hydroxyacid dehydrogenase
MPSERTAVTVIGLGRMGWALAGAFLDHDVPTTVWNRTTGKADDLMARGAIRADTIADALEASPLVVVCVLDYAAVRETLEAAEQAVAARVVVNLTNGTPRQARETAAWVAERGADYLDGGIMAIPSGIGTPEAFVLYSGSAVAFEVHAERLGLLGTAHFLGTDPGLAALHDLALLSGMYGMFGGALHALALVRSENVEASEFTSLLLIPFLDAMADGLAHAARQIDAGDYVLDVTANLEMQAAAYPNLIRASQDQGVAVDLIAPMQALMERRVADGHGDEDIAGLIELIKN